MLYELFVTFFKLGLFTIGGGVAMMDAAYFWNMFLETGSPEAYLLYREHKRDGSNDKGDRPAGDEIQ